MTRWPVEPLTFSKKNPSRAIPRSTYIHPPSLAKIGQRTSEEIGNKQTDRQTDKQTNAARFIVWYKPGVCMFGMSKVRFPAFPPTNHSCSHRFSAYTVISSEMTSYISQFHVINIHLFHRTINWDCFFFLHVISNFTPLFDPVHVLWQMQRVSWIESIHGFTVISSEMVSQYLS